MKFRWMILLLACAGAVFTDAPKSVLLVAGKPIHGQGEHEFPAGCDLLALSNRGVGIVFLHQVELAVYLIEQGAEVDMRSNRGGTPLLPPSARK
jgi:hypothetical protein